MGVKRIEYYGNVDVQTKRVLRDGRAFNQKLLVPIEYKGYFSKIKDGSNHTFTQIKKTDADGKLDGPMPKVRFPLSAETYFFLDRGLTQVEVLQACFRKWQEEIQKERTASRNKVTQMDKFMGECGRVVTKTWRDVKWEVQKILPIGMFGGTTVGRRRLKRI